MFVIYGQKHCVQVERAITHLNLLRLPFQSRDALSNNENFIESEPIPQIFKDDVFIGGFEELRTMYPL
jgi:glutaredoxin